MYSCLYAAHQRDCAVLLLVVEEERTVSKPTDKVIAPVMLNNPVLSHADIIQKLGYCINKFSIQTVKSRSDLLFTVSQITATVQAILDARSLYPDSSLADLYDPLTMPIELRKARAANDAAVLAAYGLKPDTPEPEIVAHLFKLYAEKIEMNK